MGVRLVIVMYMMHIFMMEQTLSVLQINYVVVETLRIRR